MSLSLMLAVLLAGANAMVAIGIVYSTHLTREQTAQLAEMRRELDELDLQWSQLQIEEGTYSDYARVEREAVGQLGMRLPGAGDVRLIQR